MKILLATIFIMGTASALKDLGTTTNTATLTSGYSIQDAIAKSVIDQHFLNTMAQMKKMDVIVVMQNSTKPILTNISEQSFPSQAHRNYALSSALKQHASTSQTLLLSLLGLQQTLNPFALLTFKSYWVNNVVCIRNADINIVALILNQLPTQIKQIYQNILLPLIPDITLPSLNPMPPTNLSNPQSGVAQVKAPEAWKTYNTMGEGVRVATIDTGVRRTHEALRDNYEEECGWLDPLLSSETPNDQDGHGTHTMGTIAGANGIGVAPGVKWMTCRGCNTFGCFSIDLIECGQWLVCPCGGTPETGCIGTPHVASNSWGGDGYDSFYEDVISAWRMAGIIPVFANGNSGPSCASVGSPGNYDRVIGVGSIEKSGEISSFSSCGPGPLNLLKPDVVAPGRNITSSTNTGDNSYAVLSGTSMATPHVAAVVALLLSYKPGLNFNQVYAALTSSTLQLTPTDTTCGTVSESEFPNNVYGYGGVDAVGTLGYE